MADCTPDGNQSARPLAHFLRRRAGAKHRSADTDARRAAREPFGEIAVVDAADGPKSHLSGQHLTHRGEVLGAGGNRGK